MRTPISLSLASVILTAVITCVISSGCGPQRVYGPPVNPNGYNAPAVSPYRGGPAPAVAPGPVPDPNFSGGGFPAGPALPPMMAPGPTTESFGPAETFGDEFAPQDGSGSIEQQSGEITNPVPEPFPVGGAEFGGDPGGSIAGSYHEVKSGETISSIARQYGITSDALNNANGLNDPNRISPGQILFIPKR